VLVTPSAGPFGTSVSVVCWVAAVAMLVDGPNFRLTQSCIGGQAEVERKRREEGQWKS
jgi:hypothetical protein